MSTAPKSRFRGLRFIFAAVVSCAILLTVNFGAQIVVVKSLSPRPCGWLDFDCAFDKPVKEAYILLGNGLMFLILLVLCLRNRSAITSGLLTGFVAFVLAVTVVPAASAFIASSLPSQLVQIPPVSPIPPPAGQGQIAFVAPSGDIRLINADGSGSTHLANGNSIAWSPDGSQLAYDAACGDQICLYLLTAAGNVTKFSNPAGISDETPRWSPDGRKLLFQSGNSDEIRVMNIDGSHRIALWGTIEGAAWSPDGQRIAYVNNGQIYIMRADGSGVHKLAATSAGDFEPVIWSPDGKQIYYNSSGSVGILNVNSDGTEAPALPTIDSRGLPAWSPDKRRIAFSDSQFQITAMNADGTGLTRLTHDATGDIEPRWSPDGTQIAFINNPSGMFSSGPSQLCVINADESHENCFGTDLGDGVVSLIGFPPVVFAWRP